MHSYLEVYREYTELKNNTPRSNLIYNFTVTKIDSLNKYSHLNLCFKRLKKTTN